MPGEPNTIKSKTYLLSCAVTELYDNQTAFHKSMELYCSAFTEEALSLLAKQDRDQLDIFLRPYRDLVVNPFAISDSDTPSVDNISKIISDTNMEFNRVWSALSLCNTQFPAFNEFLVRLEKSQNAFITTIAANLAASSNTNLPLGAFTIKPVQHSMRYKMTISEINKYADNPVLNKLINLLENATLRMNYHMYTKEIIIELESLRKQDKLTNHIDTVLSSDLLRAHISFSSENSHAHFLQVLYYMHKQLVELSRHAYNIGSHTFFRRSNPFLETLQNLTKRVEQRYLEEMDRRPMRMLTN